MRVGLFFVVISAALGSQVHHQNHPAQSAAEYARVLEDPSRDAWQKPHQVITALKIRPDEVIADIGAGSGYFTRRLAVHAAKVYAVDIDPDLLAMIDKARQPKVATVRATADHPNLPDGAVDTVFICDVLHHIGNRPEYYAKLLSAMKPDGRIVIIDFHKRELPVGPPVAMKLSEDQVIAEAKAAGLKLAGRQTFLPYQYFLTFRR
jgi:ubiquinone/menaquinone biosynthesis C-methylase UbiE